MEEASAVQNLALLIIYSKRPLPIDGGEGRELMLCYPFLPGKKKMSCDPF